MFEDSVATIPSIWASMNSWFTPAVLFVLLNVMIGTIAFTSTLANQNKQHHHQHQQQQQQQQQHQEHSQNNVNRLGRSPSLLQRVRSINFYSYRSEEPNLVTTTTTTTTNTNTTNTDTTHFEISPDSNTLYDFEHTHQHETLENASHYVFDQPHQESQGNDTHMQYNLFQQNLQENGEETNPQYFFEQNNEGKGEEIDSHFEFQQENVATFEKEAFEGGGEDDNGGDELQSLDEVYSKLTGRHVSRTKSDTEPSSGEVPARLPTKMRKSASLKSAFGHFEEEDIVETRRPATVRGRGVARVTEADEEVDAKADDFINRFKQQLKLQRLDSLIRYKDMITRGSGK